LHSTGLWSQPAPSTPISATTNGPSFAPGLKTIDDATYIRRQILIAFERAETEPDAAERKRLLHLRGGRWRSDRGLRTAGAIAELANRALASDFRTIDPRSARVMLVEAGARLLTPFDPSLSEKAKKSLEQLGVEVRLKARVTGCSDAEVAIGSERIETARHLGSRVMVRRRRFGSAPNQIRAGRVKVQPDLSIPGHPNVFVIGDTAPRKMQEADHYRRRISRQATGQYLRRS